MRSLTPVRSMVPVMAVVLLLGACQPAATSPEPSGSSAPTVASSPTAEPSPSEAPVAFPLEVEDARGNVHTFDKPVTRVLCSEFVCLDALATLGLAPTATSENDDFNYFDSEFFYPGGEEPEHTNVNVEDAEQVAATDSEVLLSFCHNLFCVEEMFPALEGAIEHVFYLHYLPHSPNAPTADAEAWRANLQLVGQMTDAVPAAAAAVEHYDAFVDALATRAPAGAAEIDVLPMLANDEGTYRMQFIEVPFCAVLEEEGFGRCAAPSDYAFEAELFSAEISAEAVLDLDPSWIAYQVFTPEQSWETRPNDPVWGELTAVSEGNVYDATSPGYVQPNLRVLQHALHEYAHHVWGAEAGIPDPGPLNDYDPDAALDAISG